MYLVYCISPIVKTWNINDDKFHKLVMDYLPVFRQCQAMYLVEEGGPNVVQVTQQGEQTSLLLVVPHLCTLYQHLFSTFTQIAAPMLTLLPEQLFDPTVLTCAFITT